MIPGAGAPASASELQVHREGLPACRGQERDQLVQCYLTKFRNL